MRKLIIFAIMAMATISCKSETVHISKIIVLDSNFNQLLIIEKSDSLNSISDLWKEFEPIEDIPNRQWTHKFDIESKDIGGRWLYNQEGYIAKLNKQLKPRYRVGNKDELNKILLGF